MSARVEGEVRKVFVAYPFSDDEAPGLTSKLDGLQARLADSVELLRSTPGWARGGQILRTDILPAIASATEVVAIFARPNANVAFELGCALGMQKPVKILHYSPNRPAFLQDTPFKDSAITKFGDSNGYGPAVDALRASNGWLQLDWPRRNGEGTTLLLACDVDWLSLITSELPEIHFTPGETLTRLSNIPQFPARLCAVDRVIWIAEASPYDEEQGHGKLNTRNALVAGCFFGSTMAQITEPQRRIAAAMERLIVSCDATTVITDVAAMCRPTPFHARNEAVRGLRHLFGLSDRGETASCSLSSTESRQPGSSRLLTVAHRRACPSDELLQYEWQAPAPIWSLAAAPDGQELFAGMDDGRTAAWHPGSPKPEQVWQAHGGRVGALAAQAGMLVSGSRDHSITFAGKGHRAEPDVLSLPDGAESIVLSSDGRRMTCGLLSGAVRCYDLPSRKQLQCQPSWPSSNGPARLCGDGDAQWIACGWANGDVALWSARTGRTMLASQIGSSVPVVAMSPSGDMLVAACGRYNIGVWRTANDLTPFPSLIEVGAQLLALVVDGHGRIYCGFANGRISILDARGSRIAEVQGHESWVTALVVRDGGFLSASLDRTIRYWEPPRYSCRRPQPRWNQAYLSSDGAGILALTDEGRLSLNRISVSDSILSIEEIGKSPPEPKFHGSFVVCANLRLALAGMNDGFIVVWHLDCPGREAQRILAHDCGPVHLGVSADGQQAVSGAPDGIKLWDLRQGSPQLLQAWSEIGPIMAVAISPDGNAIAYATGDGRNVLWAGGRHIPLVSWDGRLANKDLAESLAVTDEAAFVVAGHVSGRLSLWTNGGYPGRPMPAAVDLAADAKAADHSGRVRRLALSPDGAILVSGAERTVKVWSLCDRALIAQHIASNSIASVTSSGADRLGYTDVFGRFVLFRLREAAEGS